MWVLFVQDFHSTPVIHRMRSTESKISPLHSSLPSIDKQSLSSRMDGGGGLCGCGDGLGKQFGFCLAILSMWKAIAPSLAHTQLSFHFPLQLLVSICTDFSLLVAASSNVQKENWGEGFYLAPRCLLHPAWHQSHGCICVCVCVLFFNLKYHLPSHTFRFVPMKANQLNWNAFVRY